MKDINGSSRIYSCIVLCRIFVDRLITIGNRIDQVVAVELIPVVALANELPANKIRLINQRTH